ncbi:MAG: CvpA family protein [Planctomycetaceae bacterium]|nr:CvpA family protein [Planctomycetaceae bacterium]
MQTYDIVMLAVVGIATLFGLMKGFAWQVASLASLVLSYFCALRFADALAPQLNADPRWSKYLAMLIIYCGTGFAVWMVFRFVSGAIDRVKLREFDRQMGGLVGFIKGSLLCTVITFFAVSLNADTRTAVLKSKSGVYISEVLHKATPIMPPELTQLLGPYLDKLQRGLDPTQEVEHPSLPSLPQMPNFAGQGQGGAPGTLPQMQQLQQLQQLLPPGYQQQFGIQPAQGGYQQPSYVPNYGQPNYAPMYGQPNYGAGQGSYPGYQQNYQQPSGYPQPQPYGGQQPGGYSSGGMQR